MQLIPNNGVHEFHFVKSYPPSKPHLLHSESIKAPKDPTLPTLSSPYSSGSGSSFSPDSRTPPRSDTSIIHDLVNMIILNPPIPILLAAVVALQVVVVTGHRSARNCSQICGGGGRQPPQSPTIQYPFGFSPGCPIQLNCTPNGNASIGGFSIVEITGDTMTVTVMTQCDRPFSLVERLYSPNFAPTNRNAILLNNCSQASSCPIPSAMARTHFESLCTGRANGSMSCYLELGHNSAAKFVDLRGLRGLNCQYLLSGILAESISDVSLSLDVQMIELGWWLDGGCNCDKQAICANVLTPNGSRGYRCSCKHGFVGDGFKDGIGCRKG